jgi:hypothetical protein
MTTNETELQQMKVALINTAASRVLEVSGQMMANPMNHFNRIAILDLSNKLTKQILGLDVTCEIANTHDSENS